ncbi:zf-HC2 domain-containing protein [Actinokineospora enzanensis]|uniref:zf-HC2 domain-containing protein n=1 Tax=Actinokineospora enzanensis TaxID=155975 RepID=UPI0003829B0D|nr:zf-HC2 domain-containing protein [Actinokineospora enzanensis]
MSAPDCPPLGAYALGVLDDEERRVTEAHLDGCPPCRSELVEVRALLDLADALPPEALLRTKPADDLLLARTLRQIRAEAAARRTRTLTAAAAGVVVAAAVSVTVLVGRSGSDSGVAQRQPLPDRGPSQVLTAAPVAPAPVESQGRTSVPGEKPSHAPGSTADTATRTSAPGGPAPTTGVSTVPVTSTTVPSTTVVTTTPTRVGLPPQLPVVLSGTDPVTGVWLEATLTADRGGSAVRASVTGVPPGTHCRLLVVGPDDNRTEAARWVASTATARPSGRTAIPPGAVVAVEVVTEDGRTLVTARR